jgi:hypothetical protein
MAGRYVSVDNHVTLAVIQFRVGWNNGDGSPNQFTEEKMGINSGSSDTIELLDYFKQGRIREGATCWIEVTIVLGYTGSSNGNFNFSSPAGRVGYVVEGTSLNMNINGPYE